MQRFQLVFRQRFNLAGATLLKEEREGPAAPAAPGGPFAVAWRNYTRACFKKGYMYTLSCSPSSILYVADNKTLAGREDRTYEGEALGKKLAVVFFEDIGEDLVKRVHTESLGMQQSLLSIAELIRTVGGIKVPDDPERTAAQTELLLESHYQHLEILRFECKVEAGAPEVHV